MPTSFSSGANLLTFTRNPLRHSRGRRKVQARTQSSGAERIGQPSFGKNDLIDLIWPGMPVADVTAINSWWETIARGMGKTFTYTDVMGVSYSVRFATPSRPQIREKAYNSHECRVQLRVT